MFQHSLIYHFLNPLNLLSFELRQRKFPLSVLTARRNKLFRSSFLNVKSNKIGGNQFFILLKSFLFSSFLNNVFCAGGWKQVGVGKEGKSRKTFFSRRSRWGRCKKAPNEHAFSLAFKTFSFHFSTCKKYFKFLTFASTPSTQTPSKPTPCLYNKKKILLNALRFAKCSFGISFYELITYQVLLSNSICFSRLKITGKIYDFCRRDGN